MPGGTGNPYSRGETTLPLKIARLPECKGQRVKLILPATFFYSQRWVIPVHLQGMNIALERSVYKIGLRHATGRALDKE